MKTYAEVAERLSRQQAKHEKSLADAQKRGDRAGINSASRMLDRLSAYKDEVFAEQEAQKAPVEQDSFAYGGPFDPTFGLGQFALPPGTSPVMLPPGTMKMTGFNTTSRPIAMPVPSSGAVTSTYQAQAAARAQAMGTPGAGQGQGFNMESLLSYAQTLPDLFGLATLGNRKAPANAPQLDPVRINTSVSTAAQENALRNSAMRHTRNVDNTIATAPVAAALKLAAKMQGDELMSGVLQDKQNRETSLQNQQSELLTNSRNKNRMIDTDNQNRQNDFSNQQMDLRQGLLNSLGVKAAGISRDKALTKKDIASLQMLQKMFTPGLLGRNGFGQVLPIEDDTLPGTAQPVTGNSFYDAFRLQQMQQRTATNQTGSRRKR